MLGQNKAQEIYRSFICTSAGQETQKEPKEGRQDLSQSAGGIGDDNLPDVQGCLPHHQLGVGAAHVQSC